MTAEGSRSDDPEKGSKTVDGDDTADPSVVGVVLAGGTSSRFGEENKLLADLDGEPLVHHAVRTLLRAELAAVIVVVGYEAEAVRTALADLDVRVVRNPGYEAGLSTTVAAGIRAVGDAAGVVFLPGDMPAVDPATVNRLLDAYRAGLGTALAAAYDGQRGNPVLFDRNHFDELLAVEGDVGGRPVLMESGDSALVDVNDPGAVIDIDTLEDLRRQ
ncbi:nucleotidyltransferase family protein [Halalkalicoccus subterraneus]|uniref:nucleotidyltransferase family protein n=1 Tax=Halalkalicoccus subterraneus TaxID=2675002 RepID=UPI000EFD7303|nr:nucleotidyltransferase family protein [Halalkalicoccus subterraneus]